MGEEIVKKETREREEGGDEDGWIRKGRFGDGGSEFGGGGRSRDVVDDGGCGIERGIE